MTEKKPPGLLSDPWRNTNTPEVPPTVSSVKPRKNRPQIDKQFGLAEIHDDDLQGPKHATLALDGYGGVTVDGTDDLTSIGAQILAFCVDNLTSIENTLLQYGILVTQLQPGNLKSKFYVQREDGWTLAVPGVLNRETGRLQLIQALAALYVDPKICHLMKKYRIRPYKY